jgi:hypothetical protein
MGAVGRTIVMLINALAHRLTSLKYPELHLIASRQHLLSR